jgi:hypothetical protein
MRVQGLIRLTFAFIRAMGVHKTKDTTFYVDAEAGCDYNSSQSKSQLDLGDLDVVVFCPSNKN